MVFWNSEEIEKCHRSPAPPLWGLKGVGARLRYNPRPPTFFFVLWFAFRIIHRSGRHSKKWGRPGLIHHMNGIKWTQGGCREEGPNRKNNTLDHLFKRSTTWEGTESGLKLLVWLKLFVFTGKKLAFWVYLIHIWISAPPPYIYLTSTRVMNETRPSPFSLCLLLLCIMLNTNLRNKQKWARPGNEAKG